MKEYALGFLFNEHVVGISRRKSPYVVLLRKKKPEWMYNLLSGVGGGIEPGETPEQAMVREFKEETGVDTVQIWWTKFAVLEVMGNIIHVFRTFQTIPDPKTMTEEEVNWYRVDTLRSRKDLYPNTHWLISMAIHDPRWFHLTNISRLEVPNAQG